MERAVREIYAALNQHVSMLNQHEQFIAQQKSKQVLESEKELLTHAIDKGQLYTRGILFGGYAGFFTVWISMQEYITALQFVISGFFMSVSLSIFVLYTVWQNVSSSALLLTRTSVLLKFGDTPARYLEEKQKYDDMAKDWLRRSYFSWYCSLMLTIVPAVISLCILFYAFIAYIFRHIQ